MTYLVSSATNYLDLKWAHSIDSKDETNELEDALDIIRGKPKKRKISFGEKKYKNEENIPMTTLNSNQSEMRRRVINQDELEEWEDATESFENIIYNTVKINNAMKILQNNINILKEGYYKNYRTENGETLPSNSLDQTLERTMKIIEDSCKTIRTISIGEDDETEKVESHATTDDFEDVNIRRALPNEDEQTLIMHSREPTTSN